MTQADILDVLKKMNRKLEASEIISCLKDNGIEISEGTFYSSIKRLENSNTVNHETLMSTQGSSYPNYTFYKKVWWYSEKEIVQPKTKKVADLIKSMKRFSKQFGSKKGIKREENILKLKRESNKIKEDFKRVWELKAYLNDSIEKWSKAAAEHDELIPLINEIKELKI